MNFLHNARLVSCLSPLAGLMLLAGQAVAIESASFVVAELDGEYWTAAGVELSVELGAPDAVGAVLTIERLALPQPIGEVGRIAARCEALSLSGDEYRCRNAMIRVGESPLDNLPFNGDIRFRPRSGSIAFRSDDVPLLGQRVSLRAVWETAGWSARFVGSGLDVQALQTTLAKSLPAVANAEVFSGAVNFEADVAVTGAAPPRVTADLAFEDIGMSNASGTLASDGFAGQVRIVWDTGSPGLPGPETTPAGSPETGETLGGSVFDIRVEARRGEAYMEPVYFNFASPLVVEARGFVDLAAKTAVVTSATYRHADTLDAAANARINWISTPTIERAGVKIEGASFPAAYDTYVQGYLVGTPLAKLQTTGSLSGVVELRDNRYSSIDLRIDKLDADDREQRLAMYGTTGELHWRSAGLPAGPQTRLAWDGGFVYAIGYGASAMTLELAGDDIALVGDLRVPILNGALVIDTFAARNLAAERPAMDLDARLEPIGLRRLTTAFGWPAFPGTLSGELPRLSLRDGVITIGGSLVARAFDGTALISDLRIEQPFSANRLGSADLVFDNLDLGQMTEVFAFGRITGRLDGRIDDLQTVKDQPVAFDARFYSADNPNGGQRISRRAINNLSEIAGGSAALLTTGFLKVFDDFGYSGIAIRCRLRRDICEMGGLKPAGDGYYIVAGRGLPRINVIGHARQVNWSRMVAQIQKALNSPNPEIAQPSEKQP